MKYREALAEPTLLCGVMKAIGHPERLAIFRMLTELGRRVTVKEIYNSLKLEQPVVSRQLGILKNNGIVVRELEKGVVYYRVNSGSELISCIQGCLFEA